MKKLLFLLLAGTLSFGAAAQNFGDGSTGKRHKSSHAKPKKHKAKKKKKDKDKD
jgi:hypothetical protein